MIRHFPPPNKQTGYFLACLFIIVTSACSGYSAQARKDHAEQLVAQAGWRELTLNTSIFVLRSYIPKQSAVAKSLTIYIEGDGMAWLSESEPANDPTPKDLLMLNLAIKHKQKYPEENIVYLARPCQYIKTLDEKHCEQRYWTNARFAKEVITATTEAIEVLKQQYHASSLTLIGYSGGAAVATLAAAERSDVSELITVGGNLNHTLWTDYHHVTPLNQSLNPIDVVHQLVGIKQLHFVGDKDTVIPPVIIDDFVSRFAKTEGITVYHLPGNTHYCCWLDQWNDLLEKR